MQQDQTPEQIDTFEVVTEAELKATAQNFLNDFTAEEMSLVCSQLFHANAWHEFSFKLLMEKYQIREKYLTEIWDLREKRFGRDLDDIHASYSKNMQDSIAEAFEATKPEKIEAVVRALGESTFHGVHNTLLQDPNSVLSTSHAMIKEKASAVAQAGGAARAKRIREEAQAKTGQHIGVLDFETYWREHRRLEANGMNKRMIASVVAKQYALEPQTVRRLRKK